MRVALFSALALSALLIVTAGAGEVLAQVQPIGPNQSIQPNQPLGEWRSPDGRTPDSTASADCRSQARTARASASSDAESRYEREARLYDQCMKGKGFIR